MADYEFLTSTGVIVPDMADTREDVRNEYRQIFGDDLDVSSETPQGVLITAEALARDNVKRNNAALANQINPNLAGGVFLDSIWALTGGQRVKSTRTIVRGVTLTGRPQTIIPQDVVAYTSFGDAFILTGAVILDDKGVGTGVFEAEETGPIVCGVGNLQTVGGGAPGWEGVYNSVAGELGRETETDQAARLRRRRTLALQSVTLPEACVSGLFALEGVRSVLFRENVTSQELQVDDVTLAPHSVYVCVDGGLDDDIAQRLLDKKSVGAGWTGTTEVNVTDKWSGQDYLVKFSRPKLVTVYIQVTIRTPDALSDPAGTVRQSILNYSQGLMEGEEGFVVGGDVSGFEMAGAINRDNPSIFVSDIKTGLSFDALTRETISIKVSEIAQTFEGAIQVVFAK